MKYSRQSGISLLEILVTITIASILTAVAAPGVKELFQKNRARSLTNEFTSSLYQTRSEAVKRGHTVTLCATNTDQTECDNGARDFSNGWMVFTDYNSNGRFNPNRRFDTTGDGVRDTREEILHVSGVPAGGYKIQTTVNNNVLRRRLTYRPNGLPDMRGRLGMGYQLLDSSSGSANETQLARIAVGITGRLRSCIGGLDKCPAP